ncbi:MAG: helix-turn-helix domain-containing protein [Lachnospiraceae bacterium]|nr:helix-turn-helix domain-containing protein [Lachnospiraceae bacterium]
MFEQYPEIMSVYDVSEALYIGKNRTYELLEEGVLKGFRIGRIWKIPRNNLEEYVIQQSRKNFMIKK